MASTSFDPGHASFEPLVPDALQNSFDPGHATFAPMTQADGSPDPNATAGWAQIGRNLAEPTDWGAVGSGYANALLMGSTAPRALPNALYHVAGPDYVPGGPLTSLYARYGNKAYDMFNERWPDSGGLGEYHAHKIFFYDKAADALGHADVLGGVPLKIDPAHLDAPYFDTLEAPGFWTADSVPHEAITPLQRPK